MLRALVLCFIALKGAARPADAALFPGSVGGPLARTASFALVPEGELEQITVFGGTAFETTLSAPDALYAGGGVLSTVLDQDSIVLSSPGLIGALGFSGGIVDLDFLPIAGTVNVMIKGETLSFAGSSRSRCRRACLYWALRLGLSLCSADGEACRRGLAV